MATTAFTEFLPEILPQVPACPSSVAENAVRNACVDFCTGSLFWNDVQDAESVAADSFPYDLTAPSGARVVKLMSVTVDGNPVTPVPLDTLETYVGWRDQTGAVPMGFYQPTQTQLVLLPALDTTVNMILRCAYAPKRTATGVDSTVYEEYLEELVAGAFSKLMKMPGQPWSNPELSVYYADLFERAISDAAMRVNTSFARSEFSIAMRPFA